MVGVVGPSLGGAAQVVVGCSVHPNHFARPSKASLSFLCKKFALSCSSYIKGAWGRGRGVKLNEIYCVLLLLFALAAASDCCPNVAVWWGGEEDKNLAAGLNINDCL